MFENIIKELTEKACASIRYRTRKEILGENPDINDYIDEILADPRIKFIQSFQKSDGYLGEIFYGGWIPKNKSVPDANSTGPVTALRLLFELGVPKTNPIVERALNALLKDNWGLTPYPIKQSLNKHAVNFRSVLRSNLFVYFGIEEHAFIKTMIEYVFDTFISVLSIQSIEQITEISKNKLFYYTELYIPSTVELSLLTYSNSWRTPNNISIITKAINHLIELSPIPHIYHKINNTLRCPAPPVPPVKLKYFPFVNFNSKVRELHPKVCFDWFQRMEYCGRLGIIKKIPVLVEHLKELREMLKADGYFSIMPDKHTFCDWRINYCGLNLEENWRNNRWKYDVNFRSLLILKYAGMLK